MAKHQPDRPLDGDYDDLHVATVANVANAVGDDDVEGHSVVMMDQEHPERRESRPNIAY